MRYIYNGKLLSHRKEKNNAIANNMDGPRDDQTKQSKSGEKQMSYDITYTWNLKCDVNPHNYEIKADSQTKRRDLLPRGRGGMGWQCGISRRRLVYIDQISKILPYSKGNCIQYPKTNYNGKKYEKECVCVCMCVCKKSCIRRDLK